MWLRKNWIVNLFRILVHTMSCCGVFKVKVAVVFSVNESRVLLSILILTYVELLECRSVFLTYFSRDIFQLCWTLQCRHFFMVFSCDFDNLWFSSFRLFNSCKCFEPFSYVSIQLIPVGLNQIRLYSKLSWQYRNLLKSNNISKLM